MNSLSNVEARLPPGFRFHPRDEELVCDYLIKWMSGCSHPFPELVEVDLNKCEPWDIPESACVGGKEWYFYSHKDRKYATGLRTNRATVSGYWKATGKDRAITQKGALVGMRKTLVFYQGRAPKGRKTDWVMHEFRLQGNHSPAPRLAPPVRGDWVLCRVFFKSRAEIPGRGLEDTPPSPSLPALMEQEPYITFDQCKTQEARANDHQFHEQVPCFSIFSPTFSPMDMGKDPPRLHPTPKTLPHFGAKAADLIGLHNNNSSCCDHKTIRAVLNHLNKTESQPNNLTTAITMKGSPPRLGEASSDCSYLSAVWNQYSS